MKPTYEELEARCAVLAAENAGLKEACGGDGSYRDCPACAHSEYIEAPDTPATDAYLAEMRAQGVDAAIEELNQLAERSEKEAPIAAEHHRSAALYMKLFAAQVRKGVQS